MENLSIKIEHHLLPTDATTLHINGFVYANTLPEFDKILRSLFAAAKKKFIFDLADTSYVSSGGWSFILTAFQQAKSAGGEVVLAGMKTETRDSFELLEYDKVLRSFASAEEALKQGFSASKAAPSSPSLS